MPNFTGEVFTHAEASTVSGPGLVGLTTSLQADPRGSIDQGGTTNHKNFVGLYISFSEPTQLMDFYALDLDGVQGNSNEWFTSFAYNDEEFITPEMYLSGNSLLDLKDGTTHPYQWNGVVNSTHSNPLNTYNVPESLQFAINSNTNTNLGNTTPDDPRTQVLVGYNTEVTDLYILWGVQGEINDGRGAQNSLITGFTLPIGQQVPEPSSVALLGLGIMGALLRRRR